MSMYTKMARQFKAEACRKTLAASVFAPDEATGVALCPPVLCLGLDFGAQSPKATMMRLLKDHGVASPDALRAHVTLPDRPLMVRPRWVNADDQAHQPLLEVTQADPWHVLRQALALGLCSAHRYDPKRPVIWTDTSLSRVVMAYATGGFYQ